MYRIYTLRSMGYDPYVMIYEKFAAPTKTRQLQKWINSKRLFHAVPGFEDFDSKYSRKTKILGTDDNVVTL